MNREVFYVSNLISLSRFFLLAAASYFLLEKLYLASAIFLVLIWISDLLDGYFARRRNEISEFGKIIDPLADKISVAVIAIVLTSQGIIPLWYMIITILRDVIIFSGGVYLKYSRKVVLQSNWTGKITVFFIGVTLFLFIVIRWLSSFFPAYHYEYLELLCSFFILISIVLSFISLAVYFKLFLANLKS